MAKQVYYSHFSEFEIYQRMKRNAKRNKEKLYVILKNLSNHVEIFCIKPWHFNRLNILLYYIFFFFEITSLRLRQVHNSILRSQGWDKTLKLV